MQGGCDMMKRLVPICLAFLILGIVLGGPLVAKAEIVQSLLIGVKQDPTGGFTNADLNGRYWLRRLGIHNFETNSREAETCYGYADFNGTGSWTGQATCFFSDGATDAFPLYGTSSVNTDGSFTTTFDTDTDFGHFSSDMNFGISSGGYTDNHGNHQEITTFVKAPDNPFGMADINGTWQFRDLEFNNFEDVDRVARACSGTIVVNNGNWSINSDCFESNGDPEITSLSGTYTLSNNRFDFYEQGFPQVLFSAYLSKDGGIVIFTTGFSEGGDLVQFKGMALKEATKTFTNADLSGAYFFHQLSFDDFETDSREASESFGTANCDGNGNWTLTSQAFNSHGSSGSGTAYGTYSVNSDGSFTFIVASDTPNTTLTGNISGDNNTIILSQVENINDDWVTIQGTVTYNGIPLCAMVLANGQYMFSCGGQEGLNEGDYELFVPLDEYGEITLFAFVDGLAPFKVTSELSSLPSNIEMQLASPDSKTPTVTSTVVESIDNPGWVDITGFVSLEGTPLCAMVLANGQYMFSCDPYGEYQLSVPLDPNGEITLFVFVDGLQPYKEIISP
jgi:hypothetical protein